MNVGAVIVCAGKGKRLGRVDKAVLRLKGKPLFYHTYRKFAAVTQIKEIVIVLRKKNLSLAGKLIRDKRVRLAAGGVHRKDSVCNGIHALGPGINYVLIHDGARPFVTRALILRVLKELRRSAAVICAVPPVDTLKYVEAGQAAETLPREKVVCVQTPQAFKRDDLLKAYAQWGGAPALDEAQVMEHCGRKISVVAGSPDNIKITYPRDIKLAKVMMGKAGAGMSDYRVGLGVDLHRFSKTKKGLVLGGVVFPAAFGVEAVSDGDVILHAASDALCGAAGLGDIGDYYPPAAKKSKGIDSREIVKCILNKFRKQFKIVNLDLTVITERPKLAPHKKVIIRSLRNIFSAAQVNVKVKSKEGGHFFGDKDSIACLAAVLVKRC